MKYENARIQANVLLKELQPFCKKIAIVGDLRRRCQAVESIDILVVPREEEVSDLFGECVRFNNLIDDWMALCGCPFSMNEPKHKQFFWFDIWVNCYLTSEYQWGLNMAITTGCTFFSKWLVTPKVKGGALPEKMCVRDGWVWYRDKQIPTLTEANFFSAIETEWIRPDQRTAEIWRR